ncbi:MAG: matrixin family metalloprotease [Bryobacteraceae bacterium]
MTRRTRIIRALAVAAVAVLLATPSQAYYHYVHFLGSRSGPFTPVYERFDLTALSNSTVTVYVNDQGPQVYGPNDTFGSVLSQVKDAVAVWNSVSSSALRISFAGVESANQVSNTPGIDVTFIDLPPGLLGLGGPTTSTTLSPGGFFPIMDGQVMLTTNTSSPAFGPGPSYLEDFFTTAVHEFGHALGLQHSWTASAMSSPDVTRNTSRARPIDADDVASLAVLYGKAGWQQNYGTISGRVLFANGQPAALASVVALTATGPAVSSLTNPDGTYQITGLPPSNGYLLYVHPLPPNSITNDELGLRLPVDSSGTPFPASGSLNQTLFFPGVQDPSQAALISVGAGATVSNLNFTVATRTSLPIYNVQTYCKLQSTNRTYVYSGDLTPTPAFMSNTSGSTDLVIVQPPFSIAAAPQSATILGGIGSSQYAPILYSTPGLPPAIALYFLAPPGAGVGPRHLVLNFGTDIFVMPDAVNLVQQGPPEINSLTPNPDGSVTVEGAGLNSASEIFFDGLEAAVETPFPSSGTDAAGTITVVPPNGAAGQVSTITVYGPDGQNSMFLQSQNPPTYAYNVTGTPQINTISLTALPAGSSAAVDITASNINFVNGQVTVGFGTDDVTVRQVWVLSPTHIVANAVVAPGAAITPSDLSVIAGFQVIDQPGGFQTQVARPGFPDIGLPVVNADPTQQTIYPGSIASIFGTNLGATPSAVQVTLNGTQIPVLFASAAQINVGIPAGFPVGPATLLVNNGATTAFPVIVEIDELPPAIVAITNPSGGSLAGVTSNAGDLIDVVVSGLDPTAIGSSNLQVTVSGVPMTVFQVNPLPNGQYQIEVILTQSFGGAQVPLAVWVNGSSSQPVTITVR